LDKSLLDTDIFSEILKGIDSHAAIALRHGFTLITGNQAHYQRIQDLGYDLQLGNWRE